MVNSVVMPELSTLQDSTQRPLEPQYQRPFTHSCLSLLTEAQEHQDRQQRRQFWSSKGSSNEYDNNQNPQRMRDAVGQSRLPRFASIAAHGTYRILGIHIGRLSVSILFEAVRV